VTVVAGLLHLVIGVVYTSYGVMTAIDLRRGWAQRGFSHFGFAWLAMAFTCGPHHLDHALHVLAGDRGVPTLEVVALAVGLPAGVAWFLLRVEALFGGRGDRPVAGTPWWMAALPVAGGVYGTSVLLAMSDAARADRLDVRVAPNLALVGLYGAIGAVLAATQVRNHVVTGGWSVSGVSLAAVMFTCALMHGVYAAHANSGAAGVGVHGIGIDVASVPAAAYFLWVVLALHRGRLGDWNERAEPVPAAA